MGLSWCAASFYGQNLERVSLQTDGAPFILANDGKLHIALNFMIQYQAIKQCGLVGFPWNLVLFMSNPSTLQLLPEKAQDFAPKNVFARELTRFRTVTIMMGG